MRLVITLMTKNKILEKNKNKINQIFTEKMASKSEIFEYVEDNFFELDIDLLEVEFSKETIYDDLNKVISICEEILTNIQSDIDFIVANDDTDTEVNKYVEDWNNIKDFGLFVTQRIIPDIKSYYNSGVCIAYLNFEYVSFGCMF
ncbi:hypothetical protein HB785_05730 [Listeria welshimeri]|uniref:Uncharacterized protein n=1 Tax=Listeria welshimeri TaxID=1643 RepID=A0A7X0W655_LISWE|nr:hypothetical protein [Listeria welshimeri]MBC1323233.1 hypothetical protein [Listeria welshimeri]MBC1348194.1 hypothetical protein [Listeria welshimeri]MBC1361190.1 hypothetical protein [Listeria welshimeri]MBC1362808.1 hypothetical protein [Listeria welshimeri]MBC1395698.1 hypothetical protein [Listeria welshimeri]